jgi:diguanylate cyclase (GGDEF)-like protein/PAS domain S-box-containing protein
MRKLSTSHKKREILLEECARLKERVAELESTRAILQQQMEILIESEARYRNLLDESSDPIFSFFPDGTYRYVNKAFADGVGKKVEEITGRKIWDVFSKEEADKRFALVSWVIANGKTGTIEVRVPLPGGDHYYLTTASPVFNEHQQVTSVVCISKEITERIRMEKELQYLSSHDTLTSLFNRNFFQAELERIQPGRHFPISIVIADMDNLKEINDAFGHGVGDEMLREVAQELKRSFRAEDVVARIGGDEFGVLLPDMCEEAAAAAVERLRDNLARQNDNRLSLSIGMASGGEGDSLVDVMRLADDRMYQDKAVHKKEREKRGKIDHGDSQGFEPKV